MQVSVRHGFAFLCMPKCASTSVESALRRHCEITVTGNSLLKHTNFRRYARFVLPYLEDTLGEVKLETVCLVREPLSWLASWYRYRRRDDLKDPEHRNSGRSTADVSFEEFAAAYISPRPPPFCRGIGNQHAFVRDEAGAVGVDRLFAFEQMDRFTAYISERIGKPIELPSLKVSDPAGHELSPPLLCKLQARMKRDFALHARATIMETGSRPVRRPA